MKNKWANINNGVAALVRKQRENSGLRQDDMATLMGYGRLQYSKMERGISTWNVIHIYRAAEVLNVQVTDLLPFDGVVMTAGKRT